jgi:hypothetical protein
VEELGRSRPKTLSELIEISSIFADEEDAYWYVSNVSIIFDALCLFIHHLLCVLLHFVAFLCIFRN